MPRITPNWKKEKVLELYSQGVSQIEIEKQLQMTRKTIRELIKESDLLYKTKSEQWLIRYGNELDETVFDELNEDSLYWIGFLYADGHITKERGYSIQLALQKQDKQHIEKFKSFLKCSNPIRENKNNFRIRIGSQKIHQKLKDLGFDNNKSFTAKPHELVKNSRDFWRGVIDGDGGVYRYEKFDQLSLCGTFETIKGFIEFCNSNKQPSKASGKELYQVSFYGKEALQIANILYKDCKTYLNRKFDKYIELSQTS